MLPRRLQKHRFVTFRSATLSEPRWMSYQAIGPLKGFPVVALSEKGLNSKWSWYHSSTETIAKGLKEHNGPFQIITGTGPKVCIHEQFGFHVHSLTVTRSYFQTALLMRSAPAKSSTSPKQCSKISSPPLMALKPTSTDCRMTGSSRSWLG